MKIALFGRFGYKKFIHCRSYETKILRNHNIISEFMTELKRETSYIPCSAGQILFLGCKIWNAFDGIP